MNTADPNRTRKSRIHLLLIALVFLAPMIAAGVLTFAGWQPGTKGNGQPIVPQRNFLDEHLRVVRDHILGHVRTIERARRQCERCRVQP